MPNGLALIHTGLGEHEEAFEWLERAYQERNGWMAFLQVEPRFDPLRDDPRFQDLLRRMNFPSEPLIGRTLAHWYVNRSNMLGKSVGSGSAEHEWR